MARGGADAGIVHAGESRGDEAGVGEVSVEGGGVHGVEPRVLVVFSEHVQALPLVQVTSPLVLPPRENLHQSSSYIVAVLASPSRCFPWSKTH